ncbi:hypothetical protein [Arachnia propionica]|uniref:hypothetical protein n=1 Tax=Arachnia propionica TaxID=1750 RepID=UPI00163A908F|nr:hypothetical protein [Arachnia propionica]
MTTLVAVATMTTLNGSTDESSIRGSGFHGMNDLDLAVIPERDDDLQEATCCVQPDPKFPLRTLIIERPASQG